MASIPGAEVREIVNRSVFQLPCVLQFVRLLEASDWTASERVVSFARQSFLPIGGSQLSEDGFNRCRVAETSGRNKKMCSARVWSALARSDVLDNVHKYTNVGYKAETCPRGLTWPDRLFKYSLREASTPSIRELASHAQSTLWYSPGAANFCQPHFDLIMSLYFEEIGFWHCFEDAWCTCLASCGSMLLWDGSTDGPCIVLGQVTGQLALGWFATVKQWCAVDRKNPSNRLLELLRSGLWGRWSALSRRRRGVTGRKIVPHVPAQSFPQVSARVLIVRTMLTTENLFSMTALDT